MKRIDPIDDHPPFDADQHKIGTCDVDGPNYGTGWRSKMFDTYCPYCDSDITDDLYSEWVSTGLTLGFSCGYCKNKLDVQINMVPEFWVSRPIEENS